MKKIIISLNIPSSNANDEIIINLENVKYIAVSPYSISANFVLS